MRAIAIVLLAAAAAACVNPQSKTPNPYAAAQRR